MRRSAVGVCSPVDGARASFLRRLTTMWVTQPSTACMNASRFGRAGQEDEPTERSVLRHARPLHLDPGPPALPSHAGGRLDSSTSTTGAVPSPTWRPGTSTRQGLRPLRADDGHRALRSPRRTGHGHQAHAPAARVFWVVDTAATTAANAPSTACASAGRRSPRAFSHARVLASPGGDLLLRGGAQGAHPNDFVNLAEVESRLAAFERRYE